MALRVPVIVLILAFTSIPTELRRVDMSTLAEFVRFGLDVPDIVVNIIGFVPVGMVLVDRGRSGAIGIAAALSLAVEVTQLFSWGRSPSLLDVTTNTLGAAIGYILCKKWRVGLSQVTISTNVAVVAAVLALGATAMLAARITPERVEDAIDMAIATPPWQAFNERGATTPGRLEAYWSFEGVTGSTVGDDSGSGVTAMVVGGATFVDGAAGEAVTLNGNDQWLDAGDPLALRLVGSMTITAWINSSAFPRDDAAIVSAHSGLGYQLDTTIDTGPRTIGFKLANAAGQLMARYGRTPLQLNRWYHVAGVYDSAAKTLDVYLQGRPDNGCLIGELTTTQRPSGMHTFIGRRSGRRGFEFAGSIDDVRIFSRALTSHEIATLAEDAARSRGLRLFSEGPLSAVNPDHRTCPPPEPSDARIAGLLVVVGALTAVATIGLWSGNRFRAVGLVVATMAGLLLMPRVAAIVPPLFEWCVPLLTLAGSASILVAMRGETE
jgi:hypothetical protein